MCKPSDLLGLHFFCKYCVISFIFPFVPVYVTNANAFVGSEARIVRQQCSTVTTKRVCERCFCQTRSAVGCHSVVYKNISSDLKPPRKDKRELVRLTFDFGGESRTDVPGNFVPADLDDTQLSLFG